MNIKLTLLTITLGIIVCITTLPVQADAFRITREKLENSQQQNQQRDRDEDRYKKKQPSNDRQRQESSRQQQPQRERNDVRNQNRQKFRPAERKAEKRFDRYHEDRPIKRYDRDRHDRTPTTVRDYYRNDRPSSGLYSKIKRKVQPVTTVKRPRHKIIYRERTHREYNYVRGPWYYTRYISPYPRHFNPIGFHIKLLPDPYVRIVIGGFPYFYYSGVFYKQYNSGYIVVSAPIGAFVTSLPDGFIAFSIGLATYYYINHTYYAWDDYRNGYVVVEKPAGADDAIAKATTGRLFVYPNKGQDEEQQARDRYECHRWAVSETGFDPTLEEDEYSPNDNDSYRRALAACLEGRDYTVK